MKVKDLIHTLEICHPDAEVTVDVVTECGGDTHHTANNVVGVILVEQFVELVIKPCHP